MAFAALAGCDSSSGGRAVDNLGTSCGVLTDAGASQGVFNSQALECTSHICIKPIDYVGGVQTTPFCTTTCSQDSDCVESLRPGPVQDLQPDPHAKTCATGYACGIPFAGGRLCCQRLCLCKDFYGGEIPTPAACAPEGAPASCQQSSRS
jgi:hypothetical protein